MSIKSTLFSIVFLLLLSVQAFSQTSFSDDFEAYTAGAYLGASNPKWTTWANKPGTEEDGIVTDAQAHSGTKSIIISSTSSTGGPQDVVLPFGAKYTTGHFIYGMSTYIPSGKNGYFNFQGNATVGGLWAINANYNEDGSFIISSAGGVTLFSGIFEHDKWLSLNIDVNLNNNQWTVSLDGKCTGTFTNTAGANSVASIDLYPINNKSEMYVDDVYFSYDPTAASYANDASVSGVSVSGALLTGLEASLKYNVKNNGSSSITSLDLIVDANGTQTPIALSGISLAPGASADYDYEGTIILGSGVNNISVAIDKINGVKGDENECNDKTTNSFFAATPAPHKGILVEEGTGTWCQWCPRGAVFMDLLSEKYPDKFIPVAVHNNDPMMVTEYNSYLGFGSFPNCLVGRSEVVDPSAAEVPFLGRIVTEAKAMLKVGVSYNDATGDFIAQTNIDFIADATNNQYWIEIILTEDGVKGTTSSYNQSNAYAGGGNGVMGGFELLPSSVPAALMTYDHVARAIMGIDKADKFQGVFKTGDHKQVNFSTNIGTGLNIDNYNVVAVLMTAKGYDNALMSTFNEALAVGVTATHDIIKNDRVYIYPNPASTDVNFDIDLGTSSNLSISITDVAGRVVASRNYGKLSGKQVLPVNVQNLNTGIYMALIQTDFGQRIEKIIVD